MSSTTRRTGNTVAALNQRIDALEVNLDRVITLLTPEPAKRTVRKATTRKAPAKRTTAKRGTKRTATKKGRTSAKVAAKGDTPFGKDGLSRKEWNDTFSAKCRLSGKNAKGESFYSLFVQDTEVWDQVRECRLAGLTTNEVFDALTR